MRGLVRVQLFVLVIGASIAGSPAYLSSNESLPVFQNFQLDALKVHRATAYTLLVEVPCRHSCSIANIKFKIKKNQNALWRTPSDVKVHPAHNDTYNIGGLQPETLYYIRALISPPGTYTTILEAFTCPELPPPVSGLRVADAGPGWLDVRWTPPYKESCTSDYEYATRYKASGGKFTPLRTYGVVPSQQRGFIQIRPAHPCSSWPKEFCLLLADDVQPGMNHTIEVQVHRLDGNGKERAGVQSIVAFADTRPLTAALSPSTGTPRQTGGFPNEAAVRTWFIVSIVGMVLLVVFTGIVLVLLNSGVQWRQRAGRESARAPAPAPGRRRAGSEALPLTPPATTATATAAAATAAGRLPLPLPPPRRSLRLSGYRDPRWEQLQQPPPPYDDATHLSPASSLDPLFTR